MQEILGSNPVIATILYSRQSTHSVIHLVQANEYSEYSSKSDGNPSHRSTSAKRLPFHCSLLTIKFLLALELTKLLQLGIVTIATFGKVYTCLQPN